MENVVAVPLSHKLWAWFETNKKQAVGGTLAVAAVILVILFVVYQREQKEANASQALSLVAMSQMTSGGTPAAPEAYLKVATEYPDSSAAARAVLLAAGGYFTQARYDQAKAQFERFLREFRGNSAYGDLQGEALLGVAASLEADGKLAEATTAYKDLVDHHPGDHVVPQARFALARLYEAQGKLELARDAYQQAASANFYGGILADEAGMKYQELITRHPELAPKPAASLSTPAPAPTPAPPAAQTPAAAPAAPAASTTSNAAPAAAPKK
jgi:tetratricopeptide (TPR) repeat protein